MINISIKLFYGNGCLLKKVELLSIFFSFRSKNEIVWYVVEFLVIHVILGIIIRFGVMKYT